MHALFGKKPDWLWEYKDSQSVIGSDGPWLDPDLRHVYIDDGWGTSFSSLALHKLRLADGREVGKAIVKGGVYGVGFCPSGQTMYVHAGRRLLELDCQTMTIRRTWRDSIPESARIYGTAGTRVLLGHPLGKIVTAI